MKILLTTPPNQYFNVTGFTLRLPAYNLTQLATLIKEKHEVRILDNTISLFRPDDIYRTASCFKPEVIGVSVPFGAYTTEVIRVAKLLKEKLPNIVLIAGGRIPTFESYRFLKTAFDYVVKGEGEHSLLELIEYLSGNIKKDISEIQGLIYRDKIGRIIDNSLRSFVTNLDTLPFASRELLENNTSLWGYGKLALLEASRGCPYNCKFCSQPNFWGNVRVFSNKRILEELELICSQGFKELLFIDDNFITNKNGLNTPEKIAVLFKEIIKQNYSFKFGVCLRADTIAENHDLIKLGKEAGLVWVNVGFESYASNGLALIGKHTSGQINSKASQVLRENNIFIWGSHVFAYPGHTENDLNLIIQKGLKNSDVLRLTMFTPVEGSKLYDSLKKGNKKGAGFNSDELNYFNYVLGNRKYKNKIMFKFIFGLLRYYFNYRTIFKAIYSKNRITTLMVRKAYRGAVLFVTYKILRNVGIKYF